MTHENDIAILESFLNAERERFPDVPDDELFEIFSANLVNKSNELSDDEINLGILGGGGDGGIDCVYVYVNDTPVFEKEDIPPIPKNASIRIF